MVEVYVLMAVFVAVVVFLLYPRCRDRWILRGEFPAAWQAILERRLPFFRKLSDSEQAQLKRLIRLFIARKRFHGCAGVTITDEMRVTIAAEACLLLLNRRTAVYPALRHILVYPAAFRAPAQHYDDSGLDNTGSLGLLGESWSNGKVILSWDDVEAGVANFEDGRNVALHEFSHQLDSESGATNGAPPLGGGYRSWAEVLSTEFKQLRSALEEHHATLLDAYGASSPAEFFAVATETFFEKPIQMARRHPALYDEFSRYYRVDPRRWHDD